jgi:glyoxylate/succinic semialdehyde reductase
MVDGVDAFWRYSGTDDDGAAAPSVSSAIALARERTPTCRRPTGAARHVLRRVHVFAVVVVVARQRRAATIIIDALCGRRHFSRARMTAAAAPIGFLGAGIMGAAMARTLARAGAHVMVWNRSSDKAQRVSDAFASCDDAFAKNGGRVSVARCASDVGEACDVTFAMLSDPRASAAVVTAFARGLERRSDGGGRGAACYVDCSTVDGASGEASRAVIAAGGGEFLSAPVSGGWRDAAKGELLFIAGGSKAAYDAAAASMDVMGSKTWFVGDTPTHAARAKLMLQVMMGNVVGALGEMVSLSGRAGLDQNMVLEMLSHSAMGSPLTTAKGKLMVAKDFSPNFQVYLQQKDLRLALALADELDFAAPITAATNAQYVRAKALGHANSDFAAVAAAYDAAVTGAKEH